MKKKPISLKLKRSKTKPNEISNEKDNTNTELMTISANSLSARKVKKLPVVNQNKKKNISNLNCSCGIYSRKVSQGFSIVNTKALKKSNFEDKKPETIERNIFKKKINNNNYKNEKKDENSIEKTQEIDNTIHVNKFGLLGRTCNLNYIENLKKKKDFLNKVRLTLNKNKCENNKNKNTNSAKIINKIIKTKSFIDNNNNKNKENLKMDIISLIKKNQTNKKLDQTNFINKTNNKTSINLYQKAKINTNKNNNNGIDVNEKSTILKKKNTNMILNKNNNEQIQNDSGDIKTIKTNEYISFGTVNSINNGSSHKKTSYKENLMQNNIDSNTSANFYNTKKGNSSNIPFKLRNKKESEELKNELSSKTSSTIIYNDSEFGSFISPINDIAIKNNENNKHNINTNKIRNGANNNNRSKNYINGINYNIINKCSAKYNLPNYKNNNIFTKYSKYNTNYNTDYSSGNNINKMSNNNNHMFMTKNTNSNKIININNNNLSEIKPLGQDSSVKNRNIMIKSVTNNNNFHLKNNIQSPISKEYEMTNKINNDKKLQDSKLLKDKNQGNGNNITRDYGEIGILNKSYDSNLLNKPNLLKFQENQTERKNDNNKFYFIDEFNNTYNNIRIKYIFNTNENSKINNSFVIQHNNYTYTAISTENIIKKQYQDNKIKRNRNRKVLWSGELKEGTSIRRKMSIKSEDKSMKNVTKIIRKKLNNNMDNKVRISNSSKIDYSLSEIKSFRNRFFHDRRFSAVIPKNLMDSYNLLRGISNRNYGGYKNSKEYVREFPEQFKE